MNFHSSEAVRFSTHRLPKMSSLAKVAAAVAILASGCTPNPTHAETVSGINGKTLEPTQVDIAYKDDAALGCDEMKSHEDCGGSQTLDIFLPSSGAPKGTIMFIHGRGFTGGDKSIHEEMDSIFKQLEMGWAVANVNYLLTDGKKNVYPSQMMDLKAAANFLSNNADSLGIDMSKFVVAGHSAGGTLASLIGVGHNSNVSAFRGFPKVDGWISIAGIADFNLDNLSGMWGRRWTTISSFATQSVKASPVTHFDRSDPKGYWIHGVQDDFVPAGATVAMVNKAIAGGFVDKIQVDLVDIKKSGTPLPGSAIDHSPTSGANIAELTRWFKTL